MKVLVIGGMARSLLNFRGPLLKTVLSKGHTVFTAAGETTREDVCQLEDIGVEHHAIPIERAGLNPLNDAKVIYLLIKLLRAVTPDLVLSYTIKPVIYGSIAAKIVGVPRVFSIITGLGYSFANYSVKSRIIGQLCGNLYKLSLITNAGVFFQNPDDRNLFYEKRIIRNKSKTLILNGSGVDIAHYHPMALPKEPSYLLIARLLGNKGIREYVAAARLIKAKYPHVIFRLVGGTDPNPAGIPICEVSEWVRDGVIEYLGELRDVRPAIAASSVYVLPSYREGTPRTVLEAMAMGRPIITTDAPGCRETVMMKRERAKGDSKQIFRGENGFLIPPENVSSLVHAMEQFIKEPLLVERMGLRSLEIAEEKYDVHKVNTAILNAVGL